VIAVLVALVVVWQAQPAAQAAPRVRRELPSPSAPGISAGGGSASPSAVAEVVVHVVGAVRRPGLVRLPAGARVADAMDAAGGPTDAARLASVNLARPVLDGEQVVLQRRGRPSVLGAPAVSAPAAGAGPAPPVDLNTATLDVLDGLPGIGPVLAQRILDWRTAHGRFSSVDELGEVSGIGEATLSDLAPLVVV
jgi:competence protein ComEA